MKLNLNGRALSTTITLTYQKDKQGSIWIINLEPEIQIDFENDNKVKQLTTRRDENGKGIRNSDKLTYHAAVWFVVAIKSWRGLLSLFELIF